MLIVNPHNRAALFVLLVAIFALSLAGAFLWLHWSGPSDGARLPPGDQSAWKPDGVVVTPIEDKPGGLRSGDVVTAIDGQPLESYARDLFDLGAPRAAERFTMLTVLFTSNLGAAIVGGAVVSTILVRWHTGARQNAVRSIARLTRKNPDVFPKEDY
jgi:hypothetical protein